MIIAYTVTELHRRHDVGGVVSPLMTLQLAMFSSMSRGEATTETGQPFQQNTGSEEIDDVASRDQTSP